MMKASAGTSSNGKNSRIGDHDATSDDLTDKAGLKSKDLTIGVPPTSTSPGTKTSMKSTMLSDELADLEENRGRRRKGRSSGAGEGLNFFKIWQQIKYQWEVVRANPHILVVSLFIFVALVCAGLTIIFFFVRGERDLIEDERNEVRRNALQLAIETGRWFSDQLDQAILPLFSMAQFVSELDLFHDLPNRIGPAFGPDSLPFIPRDDKPVTHRNVSGVCDNPELVERFNHIASTVKNNAKMDGVLVNLQLAPEAVVCLLYPMINTEDFPPGIVMDNTGAWGHDLLSDPERKFIAEATIPSDKVVIAGPLTLRQCKGCDPTVEKAFIARIPIEMEGHEIIVNNVPYPKWGFAVALINWNALIQRSGLHETFRERGMEFRLIRTDLIVQPDGNVTEKMVVLDETDGFLDWQHEKVTTKLDTTNNVWQMTVAFKYDDFSNKGWRVWSVIAATIISLSIGVLVCTVLIQKQNYTNMKKEFLNYSQQPQKLRLRNYLEQEHQGESTWDVQEVINANPMADLFPYTTVLFADIAEFTAWSSQREPTQVFCLLQTIFCAFDFIAKKRDVFKVESSGDCYVAVTGLPREQPDHALRMVKFARECMLKINELTKMLEVKLGPDTGELRMRFGIHSGPVTAGVLLGDRSRFQLFGDTCSTAARMESTGEVDRIHLSQSTAQLIISSGRKRWLEKRTDLVQVQGKGSMQTYWLVDNNKSRRQQKKEKGNLFGSLKSVNSSKQNSNGDDDQRSHVSEASGSDLWGDNEDEWDTGTNRLEATSDSDKKNRLIEWQVDSLMKLLKKIVATRRLNSRKKQHTRRHIMTGSLHGDISSVVMRGETLLDEVTEVITLPKFDSSKAATSTDIESVKIDLPVVSQLRDYVTKLANLYHENPFHNFEHASHVTMSVHKLLHRIVTPEEVDYDRSSAAAVASDLHDYTFGINSDPLTHFAVVFSALIHDVDHAGIPNAQLAKEKPAMAEKYRYQSIAEQNSVDIAWDLLMDPSYNDLQKCLFANESELLRFRQLVVNIVLATDIFDKALKSLRELRWDKAFYPEKFADSADGKSVEEDNKSLSGSIRSMRSSQRGPEELLRLDLKLQATNRKATIVLEHIIQASDVAHTMQHWQVFKKWNERLFQEMFLAWKLGRSPNDKDPSEGWYKGELWFFDNYVIPLARKLEECGVFGVASDECLFHALENRKEWAIKGEDVVKEMVSKCVNANGHS